MNFRPFMNLILKALAPFWVILYSNLEHRHFHSYARCNVFRRQIFYWGFGVMSLGVKFFGVKSMLVGAPLLFLYCLNKYSCYGFYITICDKKWFHNFHPCSGLFNIWVSPASWWAGTDWKLILSWQPQLKAEGQRKIGLSEALLILAALLAEKLYLW